MTGKETSGRDLFVGGNGIDRAYFVGGDGTYRDFVMLGYDRFLGRYRLGSLVWDTEGNSFLGTEMGNGCRSGLFSRRNP